VLCQRSLYLAGSSKVAGKLRVFRRFLPTAHTGGERVFVRHLCKQRVCLLGVVEGMLWLVVRTNVSNQFLGGSYPQEANKVFVCPLCKQRICLLEWGLMRVSCSARLVVRTDVSNLSPKKQQPVPPTSQLQTG
jgi:hypothetical protein